MNQFSGLVIVLPTRNRSDLATSAIRSVVAQGCDQVRLLVSDNSTEIGGADELRGFCRDLASERVDYVRPPEPMSMTLHWDWAIGQALKRTKASHFLYLTDRMLARPDQLIRLVRMLRAHPDRVITYIQDPVADYKHPIRVRQSRWTGDLYAFEPRELLRLASRSEVFHPALPKMLNCAVPRTVLNALLERFGTVFDSISPDFNFAFRCLATVDEVLHLDQSIVIHYALNRSNGMSLARGVATAAQQDFKATLAVTSAFRFATPVPEVQTVGNAILHEYAVVRQETGSDRFPEIDRERFLAYLAAELDEMENAELVAQMRALLAMNGWNSYPPGPRVSRLARKMARFRSPHAIAEKLLWLSTSSTLGKAWLVLARKFGVSPPAPNRIDFESLDEALDFAIRFPPRRSRVATHLTGCWTRIPANGAKHPDALGTPASVSRRSQSASTPQER